MNAIKSILFFSFFITSAGCYSQEPEFVNASHFADVNELQFDEQNARYVSLTVKGRVYVKDGYQDYPTYGRLIGKLGAEGKFEWVVELEKSPRDFKIVGQYLYLIEQENEKTDDQTIYSVYLRKFALNGKEIGEKKLINKTTGDKYNVFADARIFENGIMTWSKLKGKENQFNVNEEELKKELYSTYQIQLLSLDGKEKWRYQFEGGVDGFTDLRMQGFTINKSGEAILSCFYGAKAKIAENEFTSELLFDEGGHQLYVNEVFLMKLDSLGKLVRCQEIAEYTLEILELSEGSDGTIYLVGFHKGNDMLASMQEDDRSMRGMRFMGKPFQYTKEESEGIKHLKEDCFLAALDAEWNPKWVINLKGEGDNRINHLIETEDGLMIAGGYSKEVIVNDTKYETHPSNTGYSNSFVVPMTKDGDFGDMTLITSPNSTGADIYLDHNGKVVVVGFFKQNNLYINEKLYLLPGKSKFAGFFYRM